MQRMNNHLTRDVIAQLMQPLLKICVSFLGIDSLHIRMNFY